MNEPKNNSAGNHPSAARVISLAGEIKHDLAGCEEFLPEFFGRTPVSREDGKPDPPSIQEIDSKDYSWLEYPEKPTAALHGRIDSIRASLKAFKESGLKTREAIEALKTLRADLASRRADLENRTEEEQQRLADLEDAYRLTEAKHGPELVRLESKIRDHRRYFQQLRDAARISGRRPEAGPKDYPSEMTMSQRQVDYQSTKARLEMVRAGLKRRRIEIAAVRAGIKSLSLEMDRLAFEEKENLLQETGLQAELKENTGRIEQGRHHLVLLRDCLGNLKQAHVKWRRLKACLMSFPRSLRELSIQAEKASRFDPGKAEEDLTHLAGELEDNLETLKDAAEDIKALGPQTAGLEQDFAAFDNKVRAFSLHLNQKTVDPLPSSGGPEDELKKTARGIYSFRLLRDSLLNRRVALASRLSERREAFDVLSGKRRNLISRQKRIIGDQAALVRTQSARRGGLDFKTRRIREELDQLRSEKLGLMAGASLWDDCLKKCDGLLEEIRTALDKLKNDLGRTHDRMTRASGGFSFPLDHDPLEAVQKYLTDLSRLNGSEDIVSGLPEQLAAYKASLIRAGLIKDLEKDCRNSQAEIERLSKEQVKISGLLKQSRRQVEGLSQEKTRLAQDMAAARNRASGLAAHLQDEIYPLIETLSLVLFQNQVKTSRILSDNASKAEEMAALTSLVAELKAGRGRAEQGQQHLGLALTALGKLNHCQQKKFFDEHHHLNERIAQIENDRQRLVLEYEQKIDELGRQVSRLEQEKIAALQGQGRLGLAVSLLGEERDRKVAELEFEKSGLQLEVNRLETEREALVLDHRQQVVALEEQSRELMIGREKAEAVSIRFGCALTSLGQDHQRREDEFRAEKKHLLSRIKDLEGKAEDQLVRVKQLEADHQVEAAALKKRINALNLNSAQLDQGLKNAREYNLQLTETVADLEKEAEIRKRDFQEEKKRMARVAKAYSQRAKRMQDQLETLEADHMDSINLVGHQAREIKIQRELLEDMMPLLSFFMEQTQLWSAAPKSEERPEELPEGSEFLVLLVHMLGHENEGLKEQVAVLTEDRLDLSRECDHLASSHRAVKTRLEEMLPVFQFLWQSWFKTTAALAEGKTREVVSTRELNVFRTTCHNQKSRIKMLAERLAGLENELAETRDDLVKTGSEKDRLAELEKELMGLYQKASAEAKRLEATRVRMSQIIEAQDKEIWEYKREHQRLLVDNRGLEAGKKADGQKIGELSDEIDLLEAQLFGLKGQAESAWAALSYLSVHAREKVGHLQSELSAQAETIRMLENRLMARTAQVSDLEKAQDRLALLFWIVGRYGMSDQKVQDALVRMADERNFKEAFGLAGVRLQQLALSAVERLRSERFRKIARQTVRRGFYSILLAGGMVMAAPQESSKAAAVTPDQVNLKPVVRQLPSPRSWTDNIVRGPMFSPHLDRNFDIGFLSPFERAKGAEHIRGKIVEALGQRAGLLGLAPPDYLDLVKKIYKKNQTVSLADLDDDQQSLAMVNRLFPRILKDFSNNTLKDGALTELYRLAARMPEAECRVWDRLYGDFTSLEKNRNKCLGMVLSNARWRLEKAVDNPAPEFAGKLKPIPDLEKLDQAGFTKIITPYFRANIKAVIAKPAFSYAHKMEEVDEYAKRLAQDMYVAAKTFGVPLTLMVSIAHQESYFANLMGDNSLSASPFQIYRPTKPLITKSMAQKGFQTPEAPERLEQHITLATYMAAFYMSNLIELRTRNWNKQKPPLCDLDRVALAYNGNEIYPGEVYKKKVRLMNYLEKVRKLASNKKSPLS